MDLLHPMSVLFECVIPGRCAIKKNGRRIFRGGVNIPSKNYLAWEKEAILHVMKANQRYKLPIEIPCAIFLEFHFKNGQSEPDTSNCVEGPQDLMQKAGVITNDKLFKTVIATKEIGLEPKTIVTILPIEMAMVAIQSIRNQIVF